MRVFFLYCADWNILIQQTGRDSREEERWGHGCRGYSGGEPAPEDYPRSTWYAISFVCACVWIDQHWKVVAWHGVRRQRSNKRVTRIYRHTMALLGMLGSTSSHLIQLTKTQNNHDWMWLSVYLEKWRNLCQHAARQRACAEGTPGARVLPIFAVDTRQVDEAHGFDMINYSSGINHGKCLLNGL